MTTHTPGPWAIAEGKTFCAIRTDGRVIADMRHVGQHYNKADARLIAAAPDLLQLCERAFRALDWDDFPQLKEDIQNAIAKATQEPTQ